MPLKPGDKAPTFTLLDPGAALHASSCRLQGPEGARVLLPQGRHARLHQQACGFRDAAAAVGDTAVLGISPDPPAQQAKFDQKYGLGFPLLADEDHAVAEAYGVWGEKSMYGKKYMGILRSAFLVDEKGKIEQAWYKVSPADTTANLLRSLQGG